MTPMSRHVQVNQGPRPLRAPAIPALKRMDVADELADLWARILRNPGAKARARIRRAARLVLATWGVVVLPPRRRGG